MEEDIMLIMEVNDYLKSKGVEIIFSSVKELVDSYLSCRQNVRWLNDQYNKNLQQVRQEIESNWVTSLEKDRYTLNQLENMTLAEIAQLIR